MNSLTRLGWLAASIALTTLPLAAIGCGGANAAPGGTDGSQGTSSDGVVVKSAVVSTSTVSATGGGCGSVSTVATSPAAAPTTLCGGGTIPLPIAADSAGCTGDEVSSITFGCVIATVPPPPAPGVCVSVPIADPGALLPPDVTAALPYIPGAVCPALGLVPPPDVPTNGPATGVSTSGGGTTPALPTTWPELPGPDAGAQPGGSIGDPAPDAGTQPGGSLPPGAPPVITCCTPDPTGAPDAATTTVLPPGIPSNG